MNRHTKVAIFVAPVLIVFGYIGSDFYMDQKASEEKVFSLSLDGTCDVLAEKCILTSGEFEVNIFDKDGMTTVNTTFPLDNATLFLVDITNNSTTYPLGMTESPYYWQSPTPLRNNISVVGDSQKLRLILKIKGGNYISEFISQTQ